MEGSKRPRLEAKRSTTNQLRRTKSDSSANESPSCSSSDLGTTLLIDNGAHTIKIGYSNNEKPQFLPNNVMKAKSERKRCFIADQIEECRDLSGLFFIIPHEKGYLTKFDVQKTIWDYTFNKFPIDECPVILTQPIFNFRTIQEYMDEILFEEYDVKSLYRTNATDLSYMNYTRAADKPTIVVDSGYSFTHIIPYIDGKKYTNGIIRMDIGGKLLTNYLKDILSYRQLHVMEETYVINHVKEDACFMADDFKATMKRAKTTRDIVKNYVLPDFQNIRRGYVHDESDGSDLPDNCQILSLNNERFSVPEILMRPNIIPGMDQAGLAECIARSINTCPKSYHRALCENIVLTGGNCLFKGFQSRVEADTRIHLPCHYKMLMHQSESPATYAWEGAKYLSTESGLLKSLLVTKAEYEENGSNFIYKKFNNFVSLDADEEIVEPPKEKFSILKHWKDENVDMFQKQQMTYTPPVEEEKIEFILEGEGIEEYDGTYVTLEFEYEAEPEEPQPEPDSTKPDDPKQLRSNKKRKLVTASSDITSPPIISRTEPPPLVLTGSSSSENLVSSTTQSPKPVATITKVYKPVFRQRHTTSGQSSTIASPTSTTSPNGASSTTSTPIKPTQIIQLGAPITLNTVLNNKANIKTLTINNHQLLNNTVILPSNVLNSKNLTVQIIPLRPDLIKAATGTSNFIITNNGAN